MRHLTLLVAPLLSAALTLLLLDRGFAADAAAIFDGHGLVAWLASTLAARLGEPTALRVLFGIGSALSTACLIRALKTPYLWLVAVFAAPVSTGMLHGDVASLCVGPAALGLLTWQRSTSLGSLATVCLAAVSPVAAAALAVAAFVRRPNVAALLIAPLVATLGERGAVDVIGLSAARSLMAGHAPGATAGVCLTVALVVVGGPLRLRLAGLAAAALALGPVIALRGDHDHLIALPLPAFLLASFGAETGWSGAGAVSAAALALAAANAPAWRARLLLALVLLEGAGLSLRTPTPLPNTPPEAVISLSERKGTVLHLPVARSSLGEPPRAALWRHQALIHRRPLYAEARAVHDDDPVLGEPGVVAIVGLLEPEAGWLVPPTDSGMVLRALGVTELVLDRAALSAENLAQLDPVLARLYGPPQRDNAAGIDLWRIPSLGARRLSTSPHLRREHEPGTERWRTLEELLAAGREPVPVEPG
ncbi:hypothetical protein LBMAG42_18940 [Deltaproteobacteria bacterium]|nr:hypothetical protein LBMAG42_18940 [Deltaproteobacteria bacterium]